jgi:hypothetical protein
MEWQSIVGTIIAIFFILSTPVMFYVVMLTGRKLIIWYKKYKIKFIVITFLLIYSVIILIMR